MLGHFKLTLCLACRVVQKSMAARLFFLTEKSVQPEFFCFFLISPV